NDGRIAVVVLHASAMALTVTGERRRINEVDLGSAGEIGAGDRQCETGANPCANWRERADRGCVGSLIAVAVIVVIVFILGLLDSVDASDDAVRCQTYQHECAAALVAHHEEVILGVDRERTCPKVHPKASDRSGSGARSVHGKHRYGTAGLVSEIDLAI